MSEHDDLPPLDEGELALLAAFQAEEQPPAAAMSRIRARVLDSTAAPTGAVIRGPWVWGAVAVVAAAAAALLTLDFGGTDATALNDRGGQQAVDTPESSAPSQAIAKDEPKRTAPRQPPKPKPVPVPAPVPAPEEPTVAEAVPEPAPEVVEAKRRKIPKPAATPPSPEPKTPEPKTPSSSLAAETRLLDRARKAVAAERPGDALALLREAEATFPDGVLRQERAALRVVALCDAGQLQAGRQAAASFSKAHPRSALRARVEGACPEPK